MIRVFLMITVLTGMLPLTQLQAAELVLNGSASYYHLTREYYVAGLYLPAPEQNPDAILSPDTAKRMQLVVSTERWSPRKWAQQWQNNISINNDNLSADTQVQQAIMEFTQFPRDDLRRHDEITIEYQPGGNTRVLLNREQVIDSSGVELFNYLLNTWIGKLPPSREFRQNILQQDTSDAAEQHRRLLLTHEIPAARSGLYSGWISAERAAQQAEQERQQQQARAAEREAEIAALEARKQREEEARRLAEERAAREAAEKLAQQRAEQLRQAQAAAIKAQAERLAKAPAKNNTSSTTAMVRSPDILAAEQDYYLQQLQWQLQRQLEADVSYPAWARQFAQEGLVEMDLELNRAGEAFNLRARDESVAKLLISEVQRAVLSAAGKIRINDGLEGQQWPLSVRYRFSLQDTPQPALAMPQPPKSLQVQQAAPAQQVPLRQNYEDAQRERILSSVEYPKAAQILKKKGLVELQVEILRDGTLGAIEDLSNHRHRELTQALINAVKQNAPFPPLPAGLSDSRLKLNVSHDFKL
ncbi:MAG: TonB family protein [Saccharospirillaceae bacterium]|nr:TonB family protein [Saccharospirillaceae bacterium]MCD8531576.1 TonB family protein [Saccharospirillaceae bacterium]